MKKDSRQQSLFGLFEEEEPPKSPDWDPYLYSDAYLRLSDREQILFQIRKDMHALEHCFPWDDAGKAFLEERIADMREYHRKLYPNK